VLAKLGHAHSRLEILMNKKPDPKPDKTKPDKTKPAESHPGMMGDGTEEQNLGQPGDPAARIKEEEVDAAFGKGGKTK